MQVRYLESEGDLDSLDQALGEGAERLYQWSEERPRIALVTGLRVGEPVFVLRAQDIFAIQGISGWARAAVAEFSEERRAQVERDIDAIRDWQRDNPQHVKRPD